MKAELKTRATKRSVSAFLADLPDPERRRDCRTVLRMMQDATGAKPTMWGSSVVGFGNYRYKYESGREGDWFLAGFSPRKDSLTLYVMSGVERHADLLKQLGKHKTGKGCLYVERLADVDLAVLERLITDSVRRLRA